MTREPRNPSHIQALRGHVNPATDDPAQLFSELRSACASRDVTAADHWLRALLLSAPVELSESALHYAIAHLDPGPTPPGTPDPCWRWGWWLAFLRSGARPITDHAQRSPQHFLIAPLT